MKAPLIVCHTIHNAMDPIGDWQDMIEQSNQSETNITIETLCN